jgi:signal transduction histidine kinase
LDSGWGGATIHAMSTTITAPRVANGMWVAIGVLWVLAFVLVGTSSPSTGGDLTILAVLSIPLVVYSSVGALVARSAPRNPIGWILLAVGTALALYIFGLAYAQIGIGNADTIGDLPGAIVAAWIGVLATLGVMPVALPFFLLFFPDGHLRSRRWRPVLWITVAAGVSMTVGALGIGWNVDPVILDPVFGDGHGILEGLYIAGTLAVVALSFAGLLALILRFREASPEHRQALRLLVGVLVGMAVAVAVMLLVNALASGGDAAWAWLVFVLAITVVGAGLLVGIPLAAAAAVLTYGIYDVGVVVKKTVVYVVLVVLFLLVLGFLAFLLNPLLLIGGVDGNGREETVARIATAVSIVVAVLVLAFRPATRLARRLVYGRRSTPYEAMSEFSERLGDAYATQDVLPRMAAILRASTGAAVARVWLRVGRELRPVAAAPPDAEEVAALPLTTEELPEFDVERAFSVRDRGEFLGALTLAMPPAEPLSKTGEQLVLDMASQAGLVLRNVRLVEELQESRRRIVAAQDERARKLERDIHDGAQQQLVALSVRLGLAEQLLARDPEKAAPLMKELKAEAVDALDTLRDLARGIYPPLLADQGLAAALDAQARKATIPVELIGDGVERYPQEVEAAIYFCCLEAIQNIAKYANASSATIRLARSNGRLTFNVEDDGDGFDPADAHGSGLTNMRDRLDALGGSLEVRSRPGEGTSISGAIPVEITS